MRYKNPVIPGFYPDPSVCRAGDRYYLAASSFQYFPGVPLFESGDLVNWRQIGHALTRPSQVELEDVPASGGVFAPTIRYHRGRFYMVTNNNTKNVNFYVWTDDIRGEWSEPVEVDQGGIDPSLLFDGDRAYFISNGEDAEGRACIVQCEIDPATGKRLTESRCIWHGAGGRYLEAPHMFHIGGWYYLIAAEGGTEYGHMEVCARSRSPWGPFENCPFNPILTNRDRAPAVIQGIGHGDLVQDAAGGWHMVCLGFRQIHPWQPYHTLGRETFLVPVTFTPEGWIRAGRDGTAEAEYRLDGDFLQERKRVYTFSDTAPGMEWVWLRKPGTDRCRFTPGRVTLQGNGLGLSDPGSPTFMALRQRGFDFELGVDVTAGEGEAGVTAYMCELEHYDLAVRRGPAGAEAVLRLNIGGIRHEESTAALSAGPARLTVRGDALTYRFFVRQGEREVCLGQGASKYLSSEVSGGFTGVMLGLWATGGTGDFENFRLEYIE